MSQEGLIVAVSTVAESGWTSPLITAKMSNPSYGASNGATQVTQLNPVVPLYRYFEWTKLHYPLLIVDDVT